jgi:uncharacterized protein YkwD
MGSRLVPLLALLSGCTTVITMADRDGGTGAQPDGGAGLCQPCVTHDDCGGPDDYCLRNNDSGEVFCARHCVDGACPDGFTCLHISSASIEADQCVPTGGTCANAPVPTGCTPACGSGETCQSGTCVPIVPTGCTPACGSGETCQNGTCIPTGGCNPACQSGQVCQNGSCITPAPYETELQHCVDVINQYRATNGKPALARSSALEAYAAAGAQSDSASGSPHGHFIATQGGGVAWAENEIPGWDMSYGGGSVSGVIDGGLQMMWDEGPGGGHYENMNSGSYTQVGCGIYVTPANEVWVVQDFA